MVCFEFIIAMRKEDDFFFCYTSIRIRISLLVCTTEHRLNWNIRKNILRIFGATFRDFISFGTYWSIRNIFNKTRMTLFNTTNFTDRPYHNSLISHSHFQLESVTLVYRTFCINLRVFFSISCSCHINHKT